MGSPGNQALRSTLCIHSGKSAVMRSWYRLVCQTSQKKRSVVAFKGGHYEPDILVAMMHAI